MRIAAVLFLLLAACGSVDAMPLGGPSGGTTDATAPNEVDASFDAGADAGAVTEIPAVRATAALR